MEHTQNIFNIEKLEFFFFRQQKDKTISHIPQGIISFRVSIASD